MLININWEWCSIGGMADDGRSEPKLITAAEAARRLGVRPATLYAYVSRGLIRSRRISGARGSWFDPAQVEALAQGGSRAARSGLNLTITTALTRIDGRSLSYRGHDAVELSHRASFEAVASLLWTGQLHHEPFEVSGDILKAARQATRWLTGAARLADRLVLVTAAAASADPLRFDLSEPAVASVGRVLIATMVDSLPPRSDAPAASLSVEDGSRVESSIAGRLWTRLSPGPAPEDAAFVLNGFLVMLADHELATSTLAARVAASTRANPYATVGAALGALDGPLHGSASEDVHRLFADAAGPRGATAAVADGLRRGRSVPGFGHVLYPDGDPRGAAGLDLLRRIGHDSSTRRRLRVVDEVLASVGARTPTSPNSDFSLGALAFVAAMPSDAGEAIFAIARTAGWIAHTLEEYSEPPLRFRARATYSGP
jgi:citrate synthase